MKEVTLQRLGVLVNQFEQIAGMVRKDTAEVLGTADPIEVIKHFDQLRQANDQIKIAREALSELADALSTENIPTLFTNRSLKTITVEGVGRVTVSYRFSASMLDKEKGMNWLRENGHGGLIQETVNSSSLSAFAKELLNEGGSELPNDIFKVSSSPYTSINKK